MILLNCSRYCQNLIIMSHARLTLLILLILPLCSNAQIDSSIFTLQQLPSKYFTQVDNKIDKYSKRLSSKTEKTLTKLSRWEEKIHGLLLNASPETANRLFAPGQPTFASLLQKLKDGEAIEQNYRAQYNEYRDKLTTGIKYIETKETAIGAEVNKVKEVHSKLNTLDSTIANSEAAEKFIKERKKQLFDASLQYIGKSKYLQKINKESYYYAETLKNYKEIFSDPSKAEATAKELLNKIPAFKKFTQQNSMLASLFGAPSGSPEGGGIASLAGLQTRSSVNALIQTRIAAGGPNAMQQFQQNMQDAQAQLSQLKDKILKAGGSSSDANIPDFKPKNMQKTKTFKQRLEKGFNLQFAKPTSITSTTTADIGLSLGYKLNDKSVIGLGISYKLGMGSIQHIKFSHEGIGLRSYIDWQLKKQFYLSGGYELNHNESFKKISQLKDVNTWKPAGLIGITKKLKIKTKFTKETKLQLLYDMLYKTHNPVTQQWLFRVGYNF